MLGDSPHELLIELAQPSLVLKVHEVHKCHRLSEAARDFLQLRAAEVVAEDPEATIIWSYSSDSTPISTNESFVEKLQGIKVKRHGRQSNDLLVERLFISSPTQATVVFKEPVKLFNKTVWTSFMR